MSKNEIVSLIETMNNYDELAAKAKAKADAIRDALKEEMKMKDGQLQGFDDFLESYKKTDADAFLKEDTENSDEDETPKPQFSGKSSGTDTQSKGDVEKPSVTFW